MKYYVEKSLKDFEFWGGAKDTVKYLTTEELDYIEQMLDMDYEMMRETEINDYFWFEDDVIAETLGYENFEQLMKEREAE